MLPILWMRAAFCVVCLVPAVTIFSWGLVTRSPLLETRMSAELSRAFGAHVRFTDVTTPRPREQVFHDFELVNLQTGIAWLQVDRLEVITHEQKRSVRAHTLTVNRAALTEIGDWLRVWLAADHHDLMLDLRADQLELQDVFVHDMPHHLVGKLEANRIQNRLELGVWGGQGTRSLLDFSARSLRGQDHLQLALHVKRPISVPRVAPPAFGRLGPEATWTGACRARWSSDTLIAMQMDGRVEQVDLDSLSDGTAFRAWGNATLNVQRFEFSEGAVRLLEGSLECRDGMLSPGLLATLRDHFGCQVWRVSWVQPHPVPFGQLELRFLLNPDGFSIAPRTDVEHWIVRHADVNTQMVMMLSPQTRVPLARLVSACSAPVGPRVNIDPQHAGWIQYLPWAQTESMHADLDE